ncbi:hypothetical protein GCM10025883_32000 [Mobilicoccus caccae]|uniref:Transcriptional regulator LacI/GalR-like sensor domain-containing protein n=2 Tax=Mobilicoccus caccae TaxID=1859295 RepID=A0ABQ6ITC2_9MICO|nr:hypothetical protein GCM10025883_32000 [Mobilicoccus caccae]
MGSLRALQEMGRTVPDDVALVCFDDPPWGDLCSPGLTAIAQPTFAMGARAVQLLARRLSDPDAAPRLCGSTGRSPTVVRAGAGAETQPRRHGVHDGRSHRVFTRVSACGHAKSEGWSFRGPSVPWPGHS